MLQSWAVWEILHSLWKKDLFEEEKNKDMVADMSGNNQTSEYNLFSWILFIMHSCILSYLLRHHMCVIKGSKYKK